MLALLVTNACGNDEAIGHDPSSDAAGDATLDARRADSSADVHAGDSASDARMTDSGADANPTDADHDAHAEDAGDAGACPHWHEFCGLFGCANPALCEAAVPLVPDVTLTMQDTTAGGHGDCASSASGVGGPAKYYSIAIPVGPFVRVVATPTRPDQRALIRVLAACDAEKVMASDIAAGSAPGEAALCIRNSGTASRRVILAVSRYSGEYGSLPLFFDLSVTVHAAAEGCSGAHATL